MRTFNGFALLLGIACSAQALAQTPPMPNQPQFRDPKTGQIWTPRNVGGVSGPNTPQDRAFNPQAQTGSISGTVVQTPTSAVLGTVPITAGPTTPIANLDNATLSAVPGQRWQVVLYLDNNSANTINPVVNCRFTNSGNPVEDVRANLPSVGAGQRVGFLVYGPATTLFVDRAECRIMSPT
jgi:hypothetical protein